MRKAIVTMNRCSATSSTISPSTAQNNATSAAFNDVSLESAFSNTSSGDDDRNLHGVISTSVVYPEKTNGELDAPSHSANTMIAQNTSSNPPRKNLDTQVTSVGDDSNYERLFKKKILIIFTGGTIGMSKDSEGVLKPSKGFLERTMANFPEVRIIHFTLKI